MESSKDKRLEELNSEAVSSYFGGILFVSVLMVTGIIGNLHVLFVYFFRMKPSNNRLFILVLCVLDLITCCVAMPFVLVTFFNPLNFTSSLACKTLVTNNYLVSVSSVTILFIISIDRYKKICTPLKPQISETLAMRLCACALLFAAVVSWPSAILYGKSTVKTSVPNITGNSCGPDDTFRNSTHLAVFNTTLAVLAGAAFLSISVMYVLIARAIAKHDHFRRRMGGAHRNCFAETSVSIATVNIELSRSRERANESVTNAVELSDYDRGNGSAGQRGQGKMGVRRTTFMFCLITAVFFLSYFPHLALNILAYWSDSFESDLSKTGSLFFNTFRWCFFVNNMANCIIYFICVRQYRQAVLTMYRKVFCRIQFS